MLNRIAVLVAASFVLSLGLSACAARFPGTAETFREFLGAPNGPPEAGGAEEDGSLVMTFFECGMGDAMLLEMPDGRTVLVDAGNGWRVDHILGYLEARGIERIDALVVTHPHFDHYGGAQKIIESVPVGVFLENGAMCGLGGWRDLESALETAGISRRVLRRGERPSELNTGGVTVEVLYPDDSAVAQADRFFANHNRGSLVLLVEHGDARILLMGDAESSEEESLLEWDRERLSADVLKLGHHASVGSSTSEFLDAVRPAIAIAQGTECVHLPPVYPRPSPFVVKRLRAIDVKLLDTGEIGTVQVVSDSTGIRWRTISGESGFLKPKRTLTRSVARREP